MIMHSTPRQLAFALAALLTVPVAASAGPKQDARAHIAKATKAHVAGKFEVALVHLEAAYKLDPQPELLFAIAQVYVKLAKCSDAITYYERFLAITKDPDAKAVVMQAIETCKAQLPAPDPTPLPTPEPPPPDPKPDPKPDPTPVAPPEEPRPAPFATATARSVREAGGTPWYKDKLGDTLVIGGVTAVVVGVAMYGGAVSDLDEAESAPTLTRYDELVDRAHSKRTFSAVLLGGGAALVGAGVVRYIVRDRGAASSSVGMVPAQGGGLVTWIGRF